MQAAIGDRLHIRGTCVGHPDKCGEIVEVHGKAGEPPYLVRFDDGHTGLVFPGPDAIIEAKKRGARAATGAKAAGRGKGGTALMELGAGSDADLLAALAEILPADDRWRHAHGSRGHGRTHVLPALIAPFLVIPVLAGRMALGTWQSVALVDLNVDNTDRQVRLSYLG